MAFLCYERDEIIKMKNFDNFLEKFFYVVVISVFLFLGTIAVMSARSNGETDYCYIEWYNPVDAAASARLMAHVPWRVDRKIAYFSTSNEALELATRMKCKF